MNILLVHCHYRLPGGEDAVFSAEKALLEKQGHRVFVYERSNEEAASPVGKLTLPFKALYNRRVVREVRALIRENRIEVMHVHNTLLLISPSVFYAAKAEGIPAVHTLHNFRLFCPNGILLRGSEVCEDCPRHGLACAVKHRCYRGSRLQSLVVAAAYALHRRLGTFRGVTLLCPTEFDRQKLTEFNRIRPTFDEQRLLVKPNPVVLGYDTPALPWQARKNQVVFAGRLEELKGLRCVINAWKLLEADGEQAPRLLVVGGDGPLREWAQQNAGSRVSFLGQMSREELHRTMAESRAVVAASLCYESFALVAAEALCLGTPVIASDLGNVGAAVAEGETGWHFAPGDAAALARCVRRLEECGSALDLAEIQRRSCQKYNTAGGSRQLTDIYSEVIQ